ncbi:glycosyltransferase [Microvirga tunisiensis]|uniref:Glycosyltransferase family 4 protein n=1 Tax=Microvirga tunisiensis TaxID=2108360 RepID=A0A5N7MSI5_9HYPH|nr:glycosyltransferase [Microvirga tunisiensis]MPR11896.1 glycosyltransferase family 4 protein [Microvirga tunisiensis]MPR29828.1 glycosyltransferase family 4 protein [Microvirga tunisiensis]
MPKSFPYDEGNLSASVDFSRDATLTIPKHELDILNEHDFYNGMTPEVAEIANKHFDVAFCAFFPRQLAALVRNFRNVIVLRPFGLSNGQTYTDITINSLGYYFMHEIERRQGTFWFGQAYDHLAHIETGVFKRRAVTLPLGLQDAHVSHIWTGTDPRILFVCPRINTSSYYKNIYNNFQRTFAGLPYIIGGAQPIPVSDPNVTGHLSNDEYGRVMREARLMFYHSQEEHHLHYHPLEAVRVGMPLIFMAGGMLDKLGGEKLPGRCSSERQARQKVERVLSGDKRFISAVIKSQSALLSAVSLNHCEPIWRAQFAKIEESIKAVDRDNSSPGKRRSRVAVFLPLDFRGGTLNAAKMTAKMLKLGAERRGDDIDVVFAYLDKSIYSKSDFVDLEELGISMRRYHWKVISGSELASIQKLSGYTTTPTEQKYLLPVDHAYDFLDCDFWLLATSSIEQPIVPLRPYCVFSQDFLQRYFPSPWIDYYENGTIQTARTAACVFASTPHTLEDVVQYVGIPRRKTALVPLAVDYSKLKTADEGSGLEGRSNYFVWPTNAAPHKNHLMTLEALSRYYQVQQGALDCHVTGVNSQLLDPDFAADESKLTKHVKEVRAYLAAHPALKQRIHFLGDLPDEEYASVIRDAQFLLHNVVMDNGTYTVIEAAYAGTPSLSSDYPPMRYLSAKFSLNVEFFDAREPQELSGKLKYMEKHWHDHRSRLPNREELERFSWETTASEFYGVVRPFIW